MDSPGVVSRGSSPQPSCSAEGGGDRSTPELPAGWQLDDLEHLTEHPSLTQEQPFPTDTDTSDTESQDLLEWFANPDQLTDVTWNPHLEYADGSKPMVTKTGSGRMSPVRARTMKEYDQQIADLKKENFSLKLRIYFLEERMQQKFDGDGEDLFKTNIELKVEVESLKKELLDKQDLLKKASTALESISSQHQVELQEAHDANLTSSDDHLQAIQGQLDLKDTEIVLVRRKLDDAQKQLLELVTCNKQLMTKLESTERLPDDPPDKPIDSKLEEKDEFIRQLQSELKNKELILEQQDEERKNAFKQAQEQIEKLNEQLASKDTGDKDMAEQLVKLGHENILHEQNALKRDKAIQGLATALQKKSLEVERLQAGITGDSGGGREGLSPKRLELEDHVVELESQLRERQLENDRIQKQIGRREAEVGRLTLQLEKADDNLRQREDGLQDLREQLREEKRRNLEKADSMANHYQAMIDDAQRQLHNQEKMLQHLSKSLQDKDRQLHDYMHMVQEQQPSTEKQDSIINNLRNQLRDKEEAIEAAIEDKYKSLEERELEIRQLKIALRERDRDIERANQMLLTAEETIDSQEGESKERDAALKQATANLKAQQRANEDQEEAHQCAMEEKEILIQRLQNSLNMKDKTFQDTIRASPSATDAMIQQLQQRLQDKDNLLQEVMVERSRAADSGESSARDLQNKLCAKDRELKDLQDRCNGEMADLTRQVQTAQSDLNKKDFELQTTETRATWAGEQQQEMLDKMRAAINEKDRTIEALVESARAKDRLFRQLREQSPDTYTGSSASKLAELQQSKDEVVRLENELQKKEDLIDRLRVAAERRSPKPDMIPSSQLNDTEEELAQRTENELRKRLQSAGVSELGDIGRLRDEIDRLHKAAERPGTPQRLQTTIGGETNLHLTQMLRDQLQEAQRLSDTLRMEREIYININQVGNAPQSDQSRAFEVELSAVQSLRQQLADGVDRNNKVRTALEAQLSFSGGKTTTTIDAVTKRESKESLEAMSAKIRSLQNELEESSRWNTSLQARLSQQTVGQQRGGGVGGTPDADISTITAISPSRPTSSTSMFLDSLGFPSTSYLPSFRQLPESESTPTEVAMEQMSHAELKLIVLKLQDELQTNHACCDALQAQVNSMQDLQRGDIPGENNADTTNISSSMRSDKLQMSGLEEEVRKLQAQLKHTKHLNELLKQQIRLNTQTENVPSGFNPELVVQMANEIERLKGELERWRQSMDSPQTPHGFAFPPQSPLGKSGAEAQKALQKQMESLRSDYNDEKEDQEEDVEIQNNMLRAKLASTEATVRSQTDKVRHYRKLLEEAGLLTPLSWRSSSESNLSRLKTDVGKPPPGKGRSSSASTGNLSGSQAVSEEMLPKLKDQKSVRGGLKMLAKLRDQVEECRDLTTEMTSQKQESATARIGRAGALQDKLGMAAKLCTSLATHLNDTDGDSSRSNSVDETDLSSRYDEALQKIRQLEEQLEKSSTLPGASEVSPLVKKLAQLDQDHQVVTERSAGLEIEVTKLRKQLSKEQKRAAVEHDLLKQNVEERDKLNADLRELLAENQTVAQKLQSELHRFRTIHLDNQNAVSRMSHKMQRLKAEVKRLQRFETEDRHSKNIDPRMMDSIERVRHKTGDSTGLQPTAYSPEAVLDNSGASLRGSPKWTSTDHLSRKIMSESSGSLKMSPGSVSSHKSPEVEWVRHVTDGSEGRPESEIPSPDLNRSSPTLIKDRSLMSGSASSDNVKRSTPRQNNERLNKEVADLRQRLEEKAAALSDAEANLQGAHRDLSRLSEEVTQLNEEVMRLHQEVDEKHNLNNTLQMELDVYDRIHNDRSQLNGSQDAQGSPDDLTLLLEELRQLRQQLVRTIDNNNILRQKLEEQLRQGPLQANHHHYYMKGLATDPTQSGNHPESMGFTQLPFGETYLDRTERYTKAHDPTHVSIRGHMTFAGPAPPDQMDVLHETDVAPGLRTEDLCTSTNSSPPWKRSKGLQQPVGSKDSITSAGMLLHGDLVDGKMNGTTGSRHVGGSMRYSIHDPMRPPNGHPGTRYGHELVLSPSDNSAIRVGSDLRSLYAIGELDDYELLKKEISESVSLLSGCEARVKERLNHFQRASPSQNIEHATLRGVCASLEQLAFCLSEQNRLVLLFWTSQLPRREERIGVTDVNMSRQNSNLRNQLILLETRYTRLKKELQTASKRIEIENNKKQQMEASAIQKLIRHSDTLMAVEGNLQR